MDQRVAAAAGSKVPDQTSLALERTALAHERTLIAWVRTCFSMIGFGLTIFTFFLARQSQEGGSALVTEARVLCLTLIAGGVVFMLLAVIQYHKSITRLFESGMEKHFSLARFAALLVCGAGTAGFWAVLMSP